MIRSLPLTALSLLLGFFFIFVGIIKVTPKVNPDIFKDMVTKPNLTLNHKIPILASNPWHLLKQQEFGRYNKVFPFYKQTGWRPLAKNFRLTIGILEIVCGAILVIIPGPLKEISSAILLLTMVGGFYTHYALKDSFERMAPSLIFSLLIICRLIILYQVHKKEKRKKSWSGNFWKMRD